MKKEKLSKRRRRFLNSDKTMFAAIKYYVDYELEKYSSKRLSQSLYAELSMSDCSRIVNLDFDIDDHNIKEHIGKAETLRNVVNEFVEDYLSKVEIYRSRIKEIDKHNDTI